jgi:hypothetical protein
MSSALEAHISRLLEARTDGPAEAEALAALEAEAAASGGGGASAAELRRTLRERLEARALRAVESFCARAAPVAASLARLDEVALAAGPGSARAPPSV